MRAAVAGSDKPVLTTFLAAEGVPAALTVLDDDGVATRGSVPSYPGPERAVLALSHAVRYARWRAAGPPDPGRPADVDTAAATTLVAGWLGDAPQGRSLEEEETAQLLHCYGLEVAPRADVHAAAGGAIACSVGVRDDPSFGSVVSFGLSGVITDLLGDTAYRLLPLCPPTRTSWCGPRGPHRC